MYFGKKQKRKDMQSAFERFESLAQRYSRFRCERGYLRYEMDSYMRQRDSRPMMIFIIILSSGEKRKIYSCFELQTKHSI